MNELEKYTASIPDSNPQKAELIRQWKVDNKWGQPAAEEAVKTEVVVEEDAPAATTPEASENLNSGDGQLESLENNDPDLPSNQNLNINVGTQDVNVINNAVEKAMVIDAQTALANSEILFRDDYDVFDPDGDGEVGQLGLEGRKSNVGIVKGDKETEDNRLVRSFIEATDLQKNQFDDLYASIYDNEDLFAVTEVTSGGGGSSMTGYMPTTTTTVTANVLKLEEAEAQLNEKVKRGEPGPTKEQIEYRARQNMFNTQARELKMDNARAFIFNMPEYKEDDEGNVLKDEDGNKIENRSEKQNIIANFIVERRNMATWTVEDFGKELALDLSELKESKAVKNAKTSSKAIEKRQSEITALQETILQKRKNGESTLEEVSKYKELTETYRDLVKYYNGQTLNITNQKVDLENRITDYTNMIADLDDSGVQLEALKRIYKPFEKRMIDLSLGAYGVLAINPAAFIEKAFNYLDVSGKLAGAEDVTIFQDEAKKLAEVKEYVADRYYQPIRFNQAFKSWSNVGEFGLDQVVQQGPILAAFATGQGGMYVIGMGAAAEYDAGRKLESEQDGGRAYNKNTVFLQSLGIGTAETLFGAAPTSLILRGTLRGTNDFAKRKLLDGWKNYFRSTRQRLSLDVGLVAADASGEWLTNLTYNGIDGKPLNQGGLEAFVVGGMFASVFSGMPYIQGAFTAVLSDYKTNDDIRANLKLIKIYAAAENNPLLSKAEKKATADMKQKLIDKNIELTKKRIDLASNNLNKQGGDLLADVTVQQEQLRIEAESHRNNNSLDSETKSKLISDLNAEFDALENAADKFKVAFTNTFGLLPKNKQEALKDQAKTLLQIDKIGNPSKEQINRKAEQLHSKEKLDDSLKSDEATLKALVGAGIDVNYTVSDTNDGAIEQFTKMMLARAADPNNSITQKEADALIKEFTEGIKDGTLNGFNVPSVNIKTGKKAYNIVTSVQNSIANERSKTQLHELGHIIAAEAIGVNPAAFEDLKNLILSYLKESNPAAHTRVVARTLNQNADEVLMVFFEEVAAKTVNLKKAKGTGFLGFFGKMLGIATSKASNTDYDYNFNGEEDIVAFAFEMATKLKNGTLTIKDVKDIQDKDYVVPDEVDMKMVNEEVVIIAKGKSSKETTEEEGRKLTPEQDQLAQDKVKEIQKLQEEANKLAEKYKRYKKDSEGNVLKDKQGKPILDPIKGPKQQRLEKELGADIKATVDSFVESRTKALYDPIALDNKRNVTRQEFVQSMKSDINAMIISEFKAKQPLEKFITSRGFLRANDLASRLGILSVDQGINQGMEAAENVAAEDTNTSTVNEDTSKKIKPSSLISKEGYAEIKKQVLAEISGIDPKNLTFKKLGIIGAEIIAKEIGVPVNKILIKEKQNLTKAEATAIQQFIIKNGQKLLNLLPEGAVTEAATKSILGTSTQVPGKLKENFYTRRKRLGKGSGLKPFVLNKNISLVDFFKVFGIVQGRKVQDFNPKKHGQALIGIADLYARLVTNEIVRAEANLSPEVNQDIAAGKSESMASREVQADAVNIFLENQSFEKTIDELAVENRQWKFMAKTIGARKLDSKNPDDVAEMQAWVRDVLAPIAPKSLFTNGTFANAGISAADRNFFFTSGMKLKDGSIGQLGELLKDAVFAPESVDIAEAVRKQTYVTGGRYGKISESFIKEFNSAEFKKKQQQKLDGLKEIFKIFETLMKKDKKNADFIIALLSSTSQGMGHFVRTAAPVKFYAKDVSSGIVEEHTMPASLVAKYLFNLAYAGKLDAEFGGIEKNYFQGALPYADDKKLKGIKPDGKPFNYTVMTPEGWKISDNIWARYFNINVGLTGGGIDPKNIVLSNGKTVFETYSITSTGVKLNSAGKSSREKANALTSSLVPKSIEYTGSQTTETLIKALIKTDESLANARKLNPEVVKAYVMDLDDTLVISKSLVGVEMPDGKKFKINATEFAKRAGILETQGAKFDFTEFEKIIEGKKGPLFKVLENINAKRGTKDFYILTARPAAAAPAIKKFLEALGISVPLKNITGLGDGKPEAKAGWFVGMAAKGYNDFYFADDHFGNVKAVQEILKVLDVKGKVQLAKASKEATFDIIVNDMIQDSSGIEAYKKYSAARAKTIGAGKGKYNFLIAPSAEDFTGLLYKMLGKGKRGDAQMAFLKTNLLDPYDRAESAVTQAKIAAANDFKALKTQLTTLPTSLSVPTGIGGFTYSHAVRVAIWTAQGMDVPGLSKRDIKELSDFIKNDAELQAFANELIVIQKGKPYPKPDKNWLGGNITSDIINNINKVNRAEYQQEWRENVGIIFSEANLNKMEAAYGTRWREALEDSIRRMKAGSNRPIGGNKTTEMLLDWLNNSVGAVMFLNTRSALLQTISAVNFINWGDNNIVKAGIAFANQKQFWADFMTLMNSDYLVERRNGLKINVSESEIADAVRDSDNKVKAAIAFLLSKGFVMTRFADSFAIATGGSTFYRNRVKALVGKGMEQKAAEAQAFEDFRQIAEESQQSSNPNRISQQQASGAGRVILAWANTPMQYARIQKRAGQDLINGRGDWKTNVSKIVYYGAVQNLIFNALQQAVFALGFGEDDEEEMDAKKSEKISRIANGMIDSQLKGLGIGGAAVVALKSTLMELGKQYSKDRPKYEEAVFDLLGFSPPLGSKVQKIYSGLRSFSWNMKDIKDKGLSLDNPAYLAGAQITTGLTNIPLDRVIKKLNSMRGIVSEQSSLWQKVALGLGWSTWDVGLGYYGGFDAAKVLTPEEELTKEVTDMKKLTKTKEQVDMLLDLGLTKKEIKALGKEEARVRKIIELQKKDKK